MKDDELGIPAAPRWLTPRQAARLLQVGPRQIYHAARGDLRAARIGGRREIRIREDWLSAWADSQAETK